MSKIRAIGFLRAQLSQQANRGKTAVGVGCCPALLPPHSPRTDCASNGYRKTFCGPGGLNDTSRTCVVMWLMARVISPGGGARFLCCSSAAMRNSSVGNRFGRRWRRAFRIFLAAFASGADQKKRSRTFRRRRDSARQALSKHFGGSLFAPTIVLLQTSGSPWWIVLALARVSPIGGWCWKASSQSSRAKADHVFVQGLEEFRPRRRRAGEQPSLAPIFWRPQQSSRALTASLMWKAIESFEQFCCDPQRCVSCRRGGGGLPRRREKIWNRT